MPAHVRYRLAVLAVLVVALVVLAVAIDVPTVGDLRRQYAGTGLLGGLAFAAVYAALTLLPIPATVFTLAAGAVFGVARGSLIVWVGSTLGAVCAFCIGRLLGRDAVAHVTGARVGTMNAFLERRGFPAVVVARLIPVVPYSAFNYLSGVTSLRLPVYAGATAVGIIPSVVVYTSLGAYGGHPGSWPFLAAVGALVLLLGAGAVVARRRRNRARLDAVIT